MTSPSATPLVLAALLVACGGGRAAEPAPAVAMGIAGAKGQTDAGAGAPDPMAKPIDAPLVLRFAYSLSEELACSESFQSDGWSAKYELTLDPSGTAALRVDADRSHAFGPSAARFRDDMEDQTTREQSGSSRSWRGTVAWSGEARFEVALEPDEAECKTLVRGRGWYRVDCPPSDALAFACVRGAIRVKDAPAEVEVFECAPPYGLPAAGELDVPLPDALPFGAAPGLELEYWRHGIGNLDAPELRLLPPETPDVVMPE
jgi:hypothetical protein